MGYTTGDTEERSKKTVYHTRLEPRRNIRIERIKMFGFTSLGTIVEGLQRVSPLMGTVVNS